MLNMWNFVSISVSVVSPILQCLFIQIGLTVGFTVIGIFESKRHCWGGIMCEWVYYKLLRSMFLKFIFMQPESELNLTL